MPAAARLVDTNVLLYAVSDSPSEATKAARAREVLQEADIGFSTQVFGEFFHQATRGRRLVIPEDQAVRIIRRLAERPVQSVTLEVVIAALQLHARHSLSYWDAAILAAASALGCSIVLSEDMQHGRDYDGER